VRHCGGARWNLQATSASELHRARLVRRAGDLHARSRFWPLPRILLSCFLCRHPDRASLLQPLQPSKCPQRPRHRPNAYFPRALALVPRRLLYLLPRPRLRPPTWRHCVGSCFHRPLQWSEHQDETRPTSLRLWRAC
jgi:hypothetical protein